MNHVQSDDDLAIRRALVESLLDERFAASPDTPRALPPTRRRWPLLAAAVLLLGVGAVGFASWPQEPAPEPEAATAPPTTRNDAAPSPPQGRPKTTTRLWRPESAAALRKALPGALSVAARLHDIAGLPVKVPDYPPGPAVPLLRTRAAVQEFVRLASTGLDTPPVAHAPDSRLELEIALPDHRHLRASIEPGESGGHQLVVHGLGAFPAPAALAKLLDRAVAKAGVEIQTAKALGIVTPQTLDAMPATARHLRLYRFGKPDLPRLARFRAATSIDLRYAGAVSDAAALHAVRQALPALRTLRVRGDHLDAPAWQELVQLTDLRDLQILSPQGSYWGVPGQRDAETLTDAELPLVRSMTALTTLVAPGSDLTDDGLAKLAGLEQLSILILSGSPRLTGSGFAAFAKHPHLEQVHLNGCTQLTDAGLRALGKLPRLRHLYLRKARRPEGAITAAGLRGLARAPRLSRLEMDSWFDLLVSDPKAFAAREKDAHGSILTPAWRQALTNMGQIPTLRWLSLSRCPDLVFEDLACLDGSAVTILNLAGTVGAAPARIGDEHFEKIFDLPRELQTIIQ